VVRPSVQSVVRRPSVVVRRRRRRRRRRRPSAVPPSSTDTTKIRGPDTGSQEHEVRVSTWKFTHYYEQKILGNTFRLKKVSIIRRGGNGDARLQKR